jgi:uncharacterized membrane protein YgcG
VPSSPARWTPVESIADAIEARTGAQVAVYTQVKPGVTTAQAENDARALMDQWGVGRKGFDDGLVILFDLDPTLRHGQVQLYAGPGFRSTFLTNEERQSIYEEDMLPYLRQGDLDGAIRVAMARVDAATTPSHAQSLERARQVNALLGLVGAPVIFLLLAGWAVVSWVRHGRDPQYLDDPSIYVAGPPADLTPASGAFVLDGGSSRRALTTALLDLASRGELSFRKPPPTNPGSSGWTPATAPSTRRARGSPASDHSGGPNRRRSRTCGRSATRIRRGISSGATSSASRHRSAGSTGRSRRRSSAAAGTGNHRVLARNRWLRRGAIEVFLGIVVGFAAAIIVSSGLGLVGVALIAAGVVTLVLAFSMPARTMAWGDGPGDAGGLQANAGKDDGDGAVAEPGRGRREAAVARNARPGDGVGNGAGAPVRARSGS